jgi:hypothetical protein
MFLPIIHNLKNDNIIAENTNWTFFESKISKHSSINSDTVLYRLPLEAKHEIYEKTLHPYSVTSILYIRVNIRTQFVFWF